MRVPWSVVLLLAPSALEIDDYRKTKEPAEERESRLVNEVPTDAFVNQEPDCYEPRPDVAET